MKILREKGFSKALFFKGTFDVKLEFLEECQGVQAKKIFCGAV